MTPKITNLNVAEIPGKIHIRTFGYEHGPLYADIVVDLRNILVDSTVKWYESGLDTRIQGLFLSENLSFITSLINLIKDAFYNGAINLTVALGCEAGQHRSVAVACIIRSKIELPVAVTHRDLTLM